MKAVILAGGLGTRLSEETSLLPKPMVEIGGIPIICHIMSIYEKAGITDFIICAGFKQHIIKQYFINYTSIHSDIQVDLSTGNINIIKNSSKPWNVTIIDTGLNTMTGGRLGRIRDFVNDETFLMTYGDGVSDINVEETIKFHQSHGKKATVTAVRAPGRFGDLELDGNHVENFAEKNEGSKSRINAGYFVLEPSVLDLIENDETIWEQEPMRTLAQSGQMEAFLFDGFWKPMDTLKDKRYLDTLCVSGQAPWLEME